ncbi:hypothetical protein POVWA2_061110 [Plasmodium ovale wallikeri]|uniref:Uncharacterized protein n=1 Tax=Plasmodium ovale wallikeri TaxID=864142 RepID=A0A1A9A365_PLAOA|nr:hypothetical protein POVWA1_061570 [Plasmodium ovale wallikeri]SBT50879.1 hypothetical protein POVWA2_061110 [Plasmodium ovale wallikeri]
MFVGTGGKRALRKIFGTHKKIKRYRTGDKETISFSLSLEINAGRICSCEGICERNFLLKGLNDVIFSKRLGVTGRETSFASKTTG